MFMKYIQMVKIFGRYKLLLVPVKTYVGRSKYGNLRFLNIKISRVDHT
jgi:hypothetical protein